MIGFSWVLTIVTQVHEMVPYPNTKAGRAALALFTRQEQPTDDYGFGVIPWLDVTAEGEEDATLPDSDDLKEAILRFMRSSTSTATATTAAAMETRVKAVIDGKAVAPKHPAHVFPEFQASEAGGRLHTGWWRFPTQSPCGELGPVNSHIR